MPRSVYIVIAGVIASSLCAALILLPGLRHPVRLLFPSTFSPPRPDITNCTHIEIRYLPSLWQRFFGNSIREGLFNAEEEQFIGSLRSLVLIDRDDISVLANELASAEYQGSSPKPIGRVEYAQITGYIGPEPGAPFVIWGEQLEVKDGRILHIFRNPAFPRCLGRIENEHLPFGNRMFCAGNLRALHGELRDAASNENKYPPPSEWCDAMEEYKRARYPRKERVRWVLKCPSQREGRCHYAMNPDCRPDSPPDMVLLFEASTGWNQHGGPELFTLDHHYPRGGCVVLNDGTVKFIRTEEELKQLRWK